jgi:hypothetical protein
MDTFEQVLESTKKVLAEHLAALISSTSDVVILRDYTGRLRIAFQGSRDNVNASLLDELALALRATLGKLLSKSGSEFFFADDLVDPAAIFESEDRNFVGTITANGDKTFNLWLLERQPIGMDWLRKPIRSSTNSARATFFGIKGGVGRSTALTAFSWYLASRGKKVLVIDLDLESPGLSSSVMDRNSRPDFGVVDWFSANSLGQDDEQFLEDMVASSPLDRVPTSLPGRIRVVPAFGTKTGDYIPKLSRSYLPTIANDRTKDFADRLAELIERLEMQENPDIVLLDSRAGIHDIAAITITRLNATAFLFGINTAQTWDGYELLFSHWKTQPHNLEYFRENLHIVSGLTPDPALNPSYLKEFLENSYDLFSENLYEEAGPTDLDAFNFDTLDDQAPHTPIVIRWDDALRAFDPVRYPDHLEKTLFDKVFGHFVKEAERLCGLEQ